MAKQPVGGSQPAGPARTTVDAAFPLPGMLVEIDGVAVLPGTGLAGDGGGQPAG